MTKSTGFLENICLLACILQKSRRSIGFSRQKCIQNAFNVSTKITIFRLKLGGNYETPNDAELYCHDRNGISGKCGIQKHCFIKYDSPYRREILAKGCANDEIVNDPSETWYGQKVCDYPSCNAAKKPVQCFHSMFSSNDDIFKELSCEFIRGTLGSIQ